MKKSREKLIRKEISNMTNTRVKVYAYLVFNELRTLESIPKRFREDVEAEVEKMKQGIFFE